MEQKSAEQGGTPDDLVIRPARKDECRRVAELYRISSGGVADYIWSQLARPGEDLLEVGRRRYEREGTPFSYQNCRLVEDGDRVVGMLVAFPMHVTPPTGEPDPVLAPYAALEEDISYYICGMAVEASHRRRGIGRRLLAEAEKSCRQLGLEKLSLIAFERNGPAMALYAQSGYRERMRRPVVPHPLIHYTGDAVLLVKSLADR